MKLVPIRAYGILIILATPPDQSRAFVRGVKPPLILPPRYGDETNATKFGAPCIFTRIFKDRHLDDYVIAAAAAAAKPHYLNPKIPEMSKNQNVNNFNILKKFQKRQKSQR